MYRTSILTILFFVTATFTHCWSRNSNYGNTVTISGKLVYTPDGTPLKQGIICRMSDNICFLTDDDGAFHIEAQEGDSLRFSYIGTIEKMLPVNANNTSIIVELDPYIPGNDEHVARVESNYPEMETELKTYISDKNARIGVAVIIAGKDTVSVNGNQDFPMMSVFKFPLSLAVAKWIDANGISLDDYISFDPESLIEDTYSPMLKKYGKDITGMSFRELLEWALIESDNNAADILLKHIGGCTYATNAVKDVGGDLDITIGASEEDMHNDPSLSYRNLTTPLAIAELFDRFDSDIKNQSQSFAEIAVMLEQCRTGADRLVVPLMSVNAAIGHKTGTGFPTSDGNISAVNDCGYIHLPNGKRYSIAVLIADSAYDLAETSKMIARISEIVYNSLIQQDSIIGDYEYGSDGSTLRITKESDKKYKVIINLFRLTEIEAEANGTTDNCLNFTGIDASGKPILGEITVNGDTATLRFTNSKWEYLPNGTTFYFTRK